MSLAELETKSIDVDFVDAEQLKRLLKPNRTEKPEIVPPPMKIVPEPQPVVKEPEPAAAAEKPALDSEQPEADKTDEPAVEPDEDKAATSEPAVAEEEVFVPPSQDAIETDGVDEIETIQSAIPLERISREDVQRQFSSIVKDLKVDLSKRSQSIDAKTRKLNEEQHSTTRVKRVKSIVSENQELFKEKQITAKWKHFAMSRSMLREYMPKVDEVIKSQWKLPLELDSSLEARVDLVVSKSGKILAYEIVESSSNRFFNHAVLQVFKNLDQLPPLPEDFSGESTDIGLRFTSNQNNSE